MATNNINYINEEAARQIVEPIVQAAEATYGEIPGLADTLTYGLSGTASPDFKPSNFSMMEMNQILTAAKNSGIEIGHQEWQKLSSIGEQDGNYDMPDVTGVFSNNYDNANAEKQRYEYLTKQGDEYLSEKEESEKNTLPTLPNSDYATLRHNEDIENAENRRDYCTQINSKLGEYGSKKGSGTVTIGYEQNNIYFNPSNTQAALAEIGSIATDIESIISEVATGYSGLSAVPSRYKGLLPNDMDTSSMNDTVTNSHNATRDRIIDISEAILDYDDGNGVLSDKSQGILNGLFPPRGGGGSGNGGDYSPNSPNNGLGEQNKDDIPALDDDTDKKLGDSDIDNITSDDNDNLSSEDEELNVPFSGGSSNYSRNPENNDEQILSDSDDKKIELDDLGGSFSDSGLVVPPSSIFNRTVGENKGIKSGLAAIGITTAAATAIGGKIYYDKKKNDEEDDDNDNYALSDEQENTGAKIGTEMSSGLNMVEFKEKIINDEEVNE